MTIHFLSECRKTLSRAAQVATRTEKKEEAATFQMLSTLSNEDLVIMLTPEDMIAAFTLIPAFQR